MGDQVIVTHPGGSSSHEQLVAQGYAESLILVTKDAVCAELDNLATTWRPLAQAIWDDTRWSGMFFGGGVSERPKENASKAFVG